MTKPWTFNEQPMQCSLTRGSCKNGGARHGAARRIAARLESGCISPPDDATCWLHQSDVAIPCRIATAAFLIPFQRFDRPCRIHLHTCVAKKGALSMQRGRSYLHFLTAFWMCFTVWYEMSLVALRYLCLIVAVGCLVCFRSVSTASGLPLSLLCHLVFRVSFAAQGSLDNKKGWFQAPL